MGEVAWRLVREAFDRVEEAVAKIVDTENAFDDLTALHLLLFDLEIAVKNARDEAIKERERRWEIAQKQTMDERRRYYAEIHRR